MNFVNNIIDGVDTVFRGISDLTFGRSASELIDIETVDSDISLTCKQGVFCSVLEILGCSSSIGNKEFSDRIHDVSATLETRIKEGGGHFIKVIFESDPENIVDDLQQRLTGTRNQSRRMGLDIDDLLDEKINENAKFCHREKAWIVFYTNSKMLNVDDEKSNAARLKEERAGLPSMGNGQNLVSYYETIRSAHTATIRAIHNSLLISGLRTKLLTTDEILRGAIFALQGPEVARGWVLDTLAYGKNADVRANRDAAYQGKYDPSKIVLGETYRYLSGVNTDNNKSLEPIIPRRIADQILTDDIFHTGNFVVARDRIYAPVEIVKHSSRPADFDNLVRAMHGTPFRIAFTITPDGLSANYINAALTSAFSWTSKGNRQINAALTSLAEYRGEVVGLSILASTWSRVDRSISTDSQQTILNTKEIEDRLNKLQASINDWGGCQSAASTPDPLEAILSTIPGLIGSHISKITPAPLVDVVSMLPISRVRMVWEKGAALYRTDDGAPMSYEQFSSEQSAWITLVVGPMGFGKSSHMNSLNLAFLFQSSDSPQLPYLRGIDFGYSGSGVVDIVRSSLPSDEKHRARYIVMENDIRFSYNSFDTAKGSRYPLPNHITFLSNFLYTVAHSMRQYDSLQGLCDMCIRIAYKRYSDENHNAGAKRYSKGIDIDVDLAVERLGLSAIDGNTTWWSLVDSLFDLGEIHLAGIAQRYAVPTLEDIVGIATSHEVESEYGEIFNGLPVTKVFARSIQETIDAQPFLRSYTRFDISDSEIILLDLAKMVPSGSSLSEHQKIRAAIVYLMAMRLLTADFFIDDEYCKYFSDKYRPYHTERIKNLTTLKKRFFIDERHRIKGIASAEGQADQMIVEGRKFVVDSMQGSQVFNDFSEKTQDLATTFIFCGSGSASSTKEIKDHYGLTDTEADILSNLRGPIPGYGAPALFRIKTKRAGTQSLRLVNTEGPIMLCAMATEGADRYVRKELYKRAKTTKKAREAFAAEFPNGSVKDEVKRRTDLMQERLYKSPTGHILNDIINDIYEKHLA